jgi:septation ring formation regulator EzrA
MICEIILGLFIVFLILLCVAFLFRKKIQSYILKKVMKNMMGDLMGGMLNK